MKLYDKKSVLALGVLLLTLGCSKQTELVTPQILTILSVYEQINNAKDI